MMGRYEKEKNEHLVALLLDFAERRVDRSVLVQIEFEVLFLLRIVQNDLRAGGPAFDDLVADQRPLQRRFSGPEFDRQPAKAGSRRVASLDFPGTGGQSGSRRLRSGS